MHKFENSGIVLVSANQKFEDALVLNDIQELTAQAHERAEPSYQKIMIDS